MSWDVPSPILISTDIFYLKISKDVGVTKLTSHSRFSDDVLVNSSIKSGEWRISIVDNRHISTDELISMIVSKYCLNEAIVNILEVYTTTFIGDYGNTKDIKLDNMANIYEEEICVNRDKPLPKVNVIINDVQIRVRYRAGDTAERDISYDSEYMTEVMSRVGKYLGRAYHWVPIKTFIYLVLDNIGGHGSNKCINDCVQMLKDCFNVECMHQIPRSPFTDALDLGGGLRSSWRLSVAT